MEKIVTQKNLKAGLTIKFNIKKFVLTKQKKAKPKKWYNYLLQSLLTP